MTGLAGKFRTLAKTGCFRHAGKTLIMSDKVSVTPSGVDQGERGLIRVKAPRNVSVHCEEIYERTKNRQQAMFELKFLCDWPQGVRICENSPSLLVGCQVFPSEEILFSRGMAKWLRRACPLPKVRKGTDKAAQIRRVGRVAEGAPLLREYGVNSSIEGSNPSLSAI